MAPKAALRPFQIERGLLLALAPAHHGRVEVQGDLADPLEKGVDLVLRPLHLDNEERLDVERIAGLDEMLADMDGGAVHELDRHGNDAGGDDTSDARSRRLIGIKAEQHGARAFGSLEQAHGHLGDDAELALRACDQSEEIVSRGVEAGAADIDDLSAHQHHAHA